MESIIRRTGETGFVQASNVVIRNTELSLKAKGMYAVIVGLPPGWRFSINGMVAICKEQYTAVTSALDELEEHGYVIRHDPARNGEPVIYEALVNPDGTYKTDAELLGYCTENDIHIKRVEAEPAEKKKPAKKPVRHQYGEYNNVLLTDEDLAKLQKEFPGDWHDRIERLSSYIASTGKSYKNHLATIRNWARKDAEKRSSKADAQAAGIASFLSA